MAEVDRELTKLVVKELIESTIQVAKNLFGVEIRSGGVEKLDGNTVRAFGVVAAVSFTGMFSGRVLVSTSKSFASELSSALLGRTADDMDVLYTFAEFGNLISGNALTKVNNMVRGANLRLTPPSAFLGDELVLSNLKVSNFNVNLSVVGRETEVLKLNVAFST